MFIKTIIANWKANPATLTEAKELFAAEIKAANEHTNIKTVICPPFVYLEELAKQLTTENQKPATNLGGQDLFWEKTGPYTGEISVDMLKNFGVSHVLIGHSDRRYKIGETDEVINKKIGAALEADITPVLLIGEQNRGDNRKQVVETQLTADLVGLTAEQVSKVLITYEPVWAISTQPSAQPDTPENTLEAIKIIDNFLTSNYELETKNYLYGGSVNQNNVADFLSHPEISGTVIGGASLHKEEFAEILKMVDNIK